MALSHRVKQTYAHASLEERHLHSKMETRHGRSCQCALVVHLREIQKIALGIFDEIIDSSLNISIVNAYILKSDPINRSGRLAYKL